MIKVQKQAGTDETAGRVSSDLFNGVIPLDHTGRPKVTSGMKAECLGEFTWSEEWPYYDEDGNLHEDHIHTHTVPWSVCKKIYKRMALAAMKSR